MSFMSGLSNLFHGIGHIFDSQNDDQQKKQQQQQAQQQQQRQQQFTRPAQQQTWQPPQKAQARPQVVIQPQQQQPTPPPNTINLHQGNQPQTPQLPKQGQPGFGVVAPAGQPAPPPKQHASVVHDITHNAITDMAGDLIKLPVQTSENFSNSFANLGLKAHNAVFQDGTKQQTIQQNMGTNPVNSALLKYSGATGKNAQLAGDAGQIAATILAPGVDNVMSKAGANIISKTAPTIIRRVIPKVLTGADVGAGYGAADTAGNGGTATDTLKSAETNAIIGAAGGGLFEGGSMLRKAISNAPKVATGVKSANPNQAIEKQAAEAQMLAKQQQDAVAAETARQNMMANDPLTKNMRTPEDIGTPAISANPTQLPKGGENFVSPHDQLAAENNRAAVQAVADDRTPAYQRRAANDQAALDAQRAEEQGTNLIDTPAFERQGAVAPAPKSIEEVNDGLRTNASQLVKEPELAPAINEAYRTTGSNNPLSLVMHALSRTSDRAGVRAIVSRLLPDIDANTLNRAVNHITGADDMTDISQALTEAATRQPGPLGPVSDAPVPAPAPAVTPDMVHEVPAPAPDVAPEVTATPAAPQPVAPVGAQIATDSPTLLKKVATQSETPPASAAVPTPSAPAEGVAPVKAAPLVTEPPKTVPTGETRPIAPNQHDQLVKQMGPEKKGLLGKYRQRPVTNYDELVEKARGVNAQLSDEDLLHTFMNTPTKDLVTDSESAAIATDALDRLKNVPGEEAQTAIQNILDALEDHASKAGSDLGFFSRGFEKLTVPQKSRYLIKQLDKANKDNPKWVELRSNPDATSPIDRQLTTHLTTAENVQKQIDALTGKIEDAAKNPAQAVKDGTNIDELTKQRADLQDKLAIENGKATDFWRSYLPKNALGNRIAEFGKTMMLSSPAGRINDVVGTASNIIHEAPAKALQGVISKAINAVKPGKALDTTKGLKAFWKGTWNGIVNGGREFDGTTRTGDLQKAVKGADGGRYEVGPTTGKFSRTVHAATKFADYASQGVKDEHIYQQASKEAEQLAKEHGWSKAEQKMYADSRAANPTSQMKASAQQLWEKTNNLNDNPLSRGLNTIGKALHGDGIKAGDSIAIKAAKTVQQAIANGVLPFTRFLGGNIWNAFADRNVIATAIKAGQAARKGDLDGFLREASRTTVGAGAGVGLGYWLTDHGVISNTDPQGYSDGGAYVNVGGRSIPVGFLIAAAPNLIIGNALHTAIHNNKGSNPVDVFTKTVSGSVLGIAKSTAVGQAAGVQNQTTKSVGDTLSGKESVGEAAAQIGANTVGQYGGGVVSDVNSVLNNGIPGIKGSDALNPTHEEADTKVTKGDSGQLTKTGKVSTAKDIIPTAKNQLLNKIPGASQSLPRKSGVAAPDELDKVTHGSRWTPGEKQAIVDAKNQTTPGSPNQTKVDLATEKANFVKMNKEMATVKGKTWINYNGNVRSFTDPKQAQQALDQDKFKDSGKQTATMNGKTYVNYNGSVKSFDNPTKAQQYMDEQKFRAGSDKEQHINGMVYQRGSNGKVTSMEQKDFDYKDANDQIASAKNSGDVSGFAAGSQKLLDNISWQLSHADLTPENRASLTQKAAQVQEEYAKTQQYGGFTKPKDTPAYATPTITGAKQYSADEQKSNGGYKDYTQVIQEKGAKYGVDINALMSVAAQEGLNGGVGDGGHAFGPFQMNDAGGVITGKFKTPAEARAYAESPQGIEDAIKQIAAVAKGKTGAEAIKAIVNGFERPADPGKEIANALALYSGGSATLAPGTDGSTGVASFTPSVEDQAAADKAAKAEAEKVKSNTIGGLNQLKDINFTGLSPKKADTAAIPTIQSVQAGDLIKKRAISVSKVK